MRIDEYLSGVHVAEKKRVRHSHLPERSCNALSCPVAHEHSKGRGAFIQALWPESYEEEQRRRLAFEITMEDKQFLKACRIRGVSASTIARLRPEHVDRLKVEEIREALQEKQTRIETLEAEVERLRKEVSGLNYQLIGCYE